MEFNNINYTTSLVFDTESNNIKLITFTKFDSFKYSFVRYKVNNTDTIFCEQTEGINFCFEDEDCCDYENPETIENIIWKIEPKKK